MVNQSKYPIDQKEIDDLRSKFPLNGKKARVFSRIIIRRLLDECERLLKEKQGMNRWFRFINGTHEIHVNMELIHHVVFNGMGQVFVDDLAVSSDSAERFRREFQIYRDWRNGHS